MNNIILYVFLFAIFGSSTVFSVKKGSEENIEALKQLLTKNDANSFSFEIEELVKLARLDPEAFIVELLLSPDRAQYKEGLNVLFYNLNLADVDSVLSMLALDRTRENEETYGAAVRWLMNTFMTDLDDALDFLMENKDEDDVLEAVQWLELLFNRKRSRGWDDSDEESPKQKTIPNFFSPNPIWTNGSNENGTMFAQSEGPTTPNSNIFINPPPQVIPQFPFEKMITGRVLLRELQPSFLQLIERAISDGNANLPYLTFDIVSQKEDWAKFVEDFLNNPGSISSFGSASIYAQINGTWYLVRATDENGVVISAITAVGKDGNDVASLDTTSFTKSELLEIKGKVVIAVKVLNYIQRL